MEILSSTNLCITDSAGKGKARNPGSLFLWIIVPWAIGFFLKELIPDQWLSELGRWVPTFLFDWNPIHSDYILWA